MSSKTTGGKQRHVAGSAPVQGLISVAVCEGSIWMEQLAKEQGRLPVRRESGACSAGKRMHARHDLLARAFMSNKRGGR